MSKDFQMDYILSVNAIVNTSNYTVNCSCGEVVEGIHILSHLENPSHKDFMATHPIKCSCGKFISENERMSHMTLEHIVYSYINEPLDNWDTITILANKFGTDKTYFRCTCGVLVCDIDKHFHTTFFDDYIETTEHQYYSIRQDKDIIALYVIPNNWKFLLDYERDELKRYIADWYEVVNKNSDMPYDKSKIMSDRERFALFEKFLHF